MNDQKNVHQRRAELVKELNFLWHSPALSDTDRESVLEELVRLIEGLRGKAVPRVSP